MLFFDLDGTLLDSNGIWLQIDIDFLREHGIDPVPQDYTDFVSRSSFNASAVFTKERFRLSMSIDQIVARWQEMAREHYAGRLPLKPGAWELLNELVRRGERLAIVTSCMPHLCMSALEHHGIAGLFHSIHYSHLLGIEKSDPDLFRQVARLEGLAPQDCVLLDDSPDYCAAAKEAGWQVWGVYDPLFDHRAQELSALCGPNRFLKYLTGYLALQ